LVVSCAIMTDKLDGVWKLRDELGIEPASEREARVEGAIDSHNIREFARIYSLNK
jgi:hypothetical protein